MRRVKWLTILLLAVSLTELSIAYAQPHNVVMLKNGSVIKGDMVVQRIGNDMTVDAENAIFIIEPTDIVSKKTRKVSYDNLSRELKRWVLENRALKGDAYERYAELEDITTDKYSFYGLVSKPNDEKGNKYVLVSPATLNIKWRDIDNIERNSSDDIKYNIVDVIKTIDGKTYSGRLTSQNAGESVTIETSGRLVTVPNVKIMEIRKEKPNNSDSYFNKIDFTNAVILKDGSVKEGLIIANHYGRKAKDRYIILLDRNGKSEKIPNSNISEFHTKYDKIEKSPYLPGKVYLNEFRIDRAGTERVSDKIVFLDKKVFPFPEGITITFKSEGSKLSGGWSLVALSECQTSNRKSSWGYKVDNKQENTIPEKSNDSGSSISSISYGYLSPGYYALVNEANTEAYVFKITK